MKVFIFTIITLFGFCPIFGQAGKAKPKNQMKVVVNPFKKRGCINCTKNDPKIPSIELEISSNIKGYVNIVFDSQENPDTLLPIDGIRKYKSYDNIKHVILYNETMYCSIDNNTINKKEFKKKAFGAKDKIDFTIDTKSLEDCTYEHKVLSFIADSSNYTVFSGGTYGNSQIQGFSMHKYEVILDIFSYFLDQTKYQRKINEADTTSTHLNKLTGFESKDRAPYSYLMSPTGDKYNLTRYHTDRYYPVVYVNQSDISAFIGWLNDIDTEYEYTLPSKVEWEYAYVKGRDLNNPNPWGNEIKNVENYCNVSDLSLGNLSLIEERDRISDNVLDSIQFLCKYDDKIPQNNGLYHMIGNVAEWVSDYKEVERAGGKLIKEFSYKGGSFWANINQINYTRDEYLDGDSRHGRIGFRICRKKRSMFEKKQ